MEQKYIISVDWFQCSCKAKHNVPLCESMSVQGKTKTTDGVFLIYKLARASEYNAIFDVALSVTLRGFTLATIYAHPRPPQMPHDSAALKVNNALLYSPNWLWYVKDILAALDWEFHCLSRVDLCCDFNFFADCLSPTEFIARYLRQGSSLSRDVQYWRVGRNKYHVIGTKEAKEKDNGSFSAVTTEHSFDYLRFGSRSSGVCVYLYNKSRELDELGHKKYIRELWHQGGLADDENTPVYRLEISVNTHGTGYKKLRTPEDKAEAKVAATLERKYLKAFDYSRLALSDFETQTEIENVFWGYASKYFRFKIVGTQKYPHRWEDVHLFDAQLVASVKPYNPSRELKTGVAERNAASTLEKILQTCSEIDLRDAVHIDKTISILQAYAKKRAGEVSQRSIDQIAEKLLQGYTFTEIGRMKLIGARQLNELKWYVHMDAINKLRELVTDPDLVARMIDDAQYWEVWRDEYAENEEQKWKDYYEHSQTT